MATINLHEDWYSHQDTILLVDDQGIDNDARVREAQVKILKFEMMTYVKLNDEGHMFLEECKPNEWTVRAFRQAELISDEAEVPEAGALAIVSCNGGDSFGFGYNYYLYADGRIRHSEMADYEPDLNDSL